MTGTGRAMTSTPLSEHTPPTTLPIIVLGTMSPYLRPPAHRLLHAASGALRCVAVRRGAMRRFRRNAPHRTTTQRNACRNMPHCAALCRNMPHALTYVHTFTTCKTTRGDVRCGAAPQRNASTVNKSSAVAEIGDRLAIRDMSRKVKGSVSLFVGGAGSPPNTMSPGPRLTCVSSGILIHPTVWPQ